MASMQLVELVPTGQVAKELATQVVRVMSYGGVTEEVKTRARAFLAQCKSHVQARDACGFVSSVITLTADDLFSFPKRRVLEDVFAVLVSMLNNASRSTDVSDTLAQLCEVVTSNTTERTDSRLLILGTAFNMFSSPSTRYDLFMRLTSYAAATSQLELVKPYFKDVGAWAKAWDLDKATTRGLVAHISHVLEEAGDFTAAQQYRVRLLEMYENESPEGLAAVRDDAVKAILGFVKTPAASSGKKHLVDMAAVQQLRGDEEHGRLFELLNVFANRKLIDYLQYREANSEYMDSLGVDHEASLETIRLFSLCSLAAESADGSISYSTIADTLQVSEEEAEEWVVSAVRAGLLTASMDQLSNTVHVSEYKRRVFDEAAWREIQGKVHRWHTSVKELLSTLRSRTSATM